MLSYNQYVEQIYNCLINVSVINDKGIEISSEDGMNEWCIQTNEVKEYNRSIYFIGNGASAMMASHMAADTSKNGILRAYALNDPAFLTAISNDLSYDKVFSLPLELYADKDDVLVAISSSGNSPNIIDAIKAARKKGMYIITLSGMKSDNQARKLGNLNIYISSMSYGIVEAAHQAILHCWLDLFLQSEVDKK